MLYVRLSTPPTVPCTGYELWSGFNVTMAIRRMDSIASFVTLTTLTGHILATGQTPSFEAVGTVLIAYINGTEIGRYDTAGDATKYASGDAGIGAYWSNAGIIDFWDNFECGNVTAPAAESPLLTVLRAQESART
jgi:hypothetical protein